jgi:hypothetical protein
MGVRARPVPISRCATEAFRLPVTGSSTVDPFLGKKARSSKAVSAPGGCGQRRRGGDRRSRAGAPAQPPHSTASPRPARTVLCPCCVDDLVPGRRSTSTMCVISDSSTGPLRSSGGAAKARPIGVRLMGTRPVPHSCMIRLSSCGWPPEASEAWHVTRVGWPASRGRLPKIIQTGSWRADAGIDTTSSIRLQGWPDADVGDFCPGRQGDRGVHELGDGFRLEEELRAVDLVPFGVEPRL